MKMAIETTRITNDSEERSLYSHGLVCVSFILPTLGNGRREVQVEMEFAIGEVR